MSLDPHNKSRVHEFLGGGDLLLSPLPFYEEKTKAQVEVPPRRRGRCDHCSNSLRATFILSHLQEILPRALFPRPQQNAEAEIRTHYTRSVSSAAGEKPQQRGKGRSETGALQRRSMAKRGSASAPQGWGLRAARTRPKGGGQAGRLEEQNGGREEGTGRRTVADEVQYGAPGALRVVPPRDAGAGGRAALPALGVGSLHAGGLPPQGDLPAARELPQQQAQRPQRVSASRSSPVLALAVPLSPRPESWGLAALIGRGSFPNQDSICTRVATEGPRNN